MSREPNAAAEYRFGDKALSWEEIRSRILTCDLTIDDSHGLIASEQKVLRYLKQLGFVVLRRGWPDFLCARIGGEHDEIGIFAVEVKDLPGTSELNDYQRSAHFLLQRAGIPVYVVRPEFVERERRHGGGLSRGDRMVWLPTQNDVSCLQSRLAALELEAAALRRLVNASAFAFDESAANGLHWHDPLSQMEDESIARLRLRQAEERNETLNDVAGRLEQSGGEPES